MSSDTPQLGYWIQTVALLLPGIAATIACCISAYQAKLLRVQLESSDNASTSHQSLLREQLVLQEKIAKLRATIEIVRHEQSDKELLEASKAYATFRDAGKLTQMAITHPEPLAEHDLVLRKLNNYEYVATGILAGALDEDIYRRMKKSNLIRDWDAMKPYVCELRSKYKKPQLFVEFEALAEKWRNS